jgi:hypothetical protein
MTVYLSDRLISDMEKIVNTKFSSAEKAEMKHKIRDYFIRIHNEACDASVIANNKRIALRPNFEDL